MTELTVLGELARIGVKRISMQSVMDSGHGWTGGGTGRVLVLGVGEKECMGGGRDVVEGTAVGAGSMRVRWRCAGRRRRWFVLARMDVALRFWRRRRVPMKPVLLRKVSALVLAGRGAN